MWIPETIAGSGSPTEAFTAEVAFSDGASVRFSGAQTGGEQFLPYGIESVPPKGELAAVVQAGRTLCSLGTQCGGRLELEPGEIGLFSRGGASLVLKNDGRVLINGRELTAADG